MPFCSHCPSSCHIRPHPASSNGLHPGLLLSLLLCFSRSQILGLAEEGSQLHSLALQGSCVSFALPFCPLGCTGLCFQDTGLLYGPVRVLLSIFHTISCLLTLTYSSKSNPSAAPCSGFQDLLLPKGFLSKTCSTSSVLDLGA